MWVQVGSKMSKKGNFHTSHFIPNKVFLKIKVLNSGSLLTLKKRKDELTDLHLKPAF